MTKKIKGKTKKLLRVKKEAAKEFQMGEETRSLLPRFAFARGNEKKGKDNRNVDKIKRTKISVIGIGGGGGSIVSELAFQVPKVNFVAANTDIQALKTINKKVSCFQFGQNLTHGLGTGMKVDLGREAAQNEKDRIKKLCQGQDLCIIVACLGGGTGSGAAPIFAKISKSLGNLTYGIFTFPFQFEGEKKMEIAKDAFKKTKSHLDAITLIPNERVFQIIDKDTPLRQALSVINKSLAKGLEGLIETIYEPGLINVDFADFKTVFKNKGKIAYLNTAEASITQAERSEAQRRRRDEVSSLKEGSIKDLMDQVLNSLLYPYTIQGAKGVLFNISGEKNLSLLEVDQISKSISELVSPEAKIIFGTRILTNKKYSEPTIKITLLAIGCGQRKRVIKKEKKSVTKERPVRYRGDKKEQVIKPETRASKASSKRLRLSSSLRSADASLVSEVSQVKTKSFPKINPVRNQEFLNRVTSVKKKISNRAKKSEKLSKKDQSLTKLAKKIKNKIKIKIIKKREKEMPTELPITQAPAKRKRGDEASSLTQASEASQVKTKFSPSTQTNKPTETADERVRKSGIQIKEEAQEFEKEILEKEKFWEAPAFLRRKSTK